MDADARKPDAASTTRLYWCRSCGRIQWSDDAPLCRHAVFDGPRVARMEPIPSYHPLAAEPTP